MRIDIRDAESLIISPSVQIAAVVLLGPTSLVEMSLFSRSHRVRSLPLS